jgi:hypothetical protein
VITAAHGFERWSLVFNECIIAEALTEILRNPALWTYYRQYGTFVETGSK